MDTSKKFVNPNPKLKANFLSKVTFFWVLSLFKKGYSNDLEVKDIYNTLEEDQSEPITNELQRNWEKEMARAKEKNRKPSLFKAITATFWKDYFSWGILLFIQSVFMKTALPVFLGKLISYFDKKSDQTIEEAYMYGTLVVLLTILSTFFMFHSGLGVQIIGMRCRVSCCSLVYRKMLRLSGTAIGNTAVGQIINLISNDVNRFDITSIYLHYIWIMPIQAVTISYFMWKSVGVSAFAGIAVITAQAVPLQGYLSRKTAKLRFHIAHRTDERVRLMNEIVSGIQVIKMYTWEKPFGEVVRLARKYEIDLLTLTSYIRGFSVALMVYTERLSLYTTVISFVLMGNEMSADKVFSMAQFFNIMQLYMAIFFPLGISLAGEARISIRRLETFLLQEEKTKSIEENNEYTDIKKTALDEAVVLKNVHASWVPNQIAETLSEINISLKPGQLCAIIGPVGSGKSSLLQLLLKELPIVQGTLSIGGKISYSAQEPWLFQASVRNNILFGQPYNKQRYNMTVKVCGLLRDFEQLPYGDKTHVGDRGASLSGGQKSRVNLARAVYRTADIYLLDDPLSAVDTNVGRHLFDQCIKEHLKNYTRILVTHQIQYLKEADLIVVLNNGRIEIQGTWDEISKNQECLQMIATNKDEEEVPQEITPRERLMSQISSQSTFDETEEPQETEELVEKGALKSGVFFKYLRAGGGVFLLGFLLFSLILAQAASSGADYWVTYWTNQEDLKRASRTNDNFNQTVNNDTFDSNLEMLIQDAANINNTDFTTISSVHDFDTENDTENFINLSNLTITDQFETDAEFLSTEMYIYVYSILIAGSVILTTFRSLFFFKICMNASKGLHDTMFMNILQATMYFFNTNPSGRILNRFSKDMGAIDESLPRALLDAVQIFLVMSGILTMVAITNPYLILAMVIMGILFHKARQIYLATAQDIKRLEGTTRSPAFSHVNASLDGIITIRSCQAEKLLQREFDNQQDLHTGTWYLVVATSVAFGFYLDMISITFMAVVTYSFLILDDGTTFSGNVGLAISQSMILTGMLQYGVRQTAEVMNQLTSVERILQYTRLDKEGPFESEPGKKPVVTWPHSGEIKFNHMFLKYTVSDPPVLKDLNFTIEAGHKVGIVGRTGAGKSSLISALFRLAPLEGEINIDNVSTTTVGLNDLRSRISIIPQQPVLFSSSLRNNLDPFQQVTDDFLWQALEEVELKDAVESLDFKVKEGGSNFSVGQRQLLCLARAIIRNNKILVLDEATANVDPQTDSLIQNTIRNKFRSCTVLTIAHRLNTIMDSDKVLVMDFGKVVEYDHPHILLQENGMFSKMLAETGKSMEQQLKSIAKLAYEKKMNLQSDSST